MTFVPSSPPVRSKRVDMATLCAVLDPLLRAPAEVYLFPNGRRFLEDQSIGSPPPAPSPLPDGVYRFEPDTGVYYVTSADTSVYYVTE